MNWSERKIIYKLINLKLEHLNDNYKIKMKCYKNSIYDVNLIFNHVCLSNTWVQSLQTKLKNIFEKNMSEYHIIVNVMLDMFFLAHNLFIDELTELHDQK